MEKNMETTRFFYRGYIGNIGMMEKTMETTISYMGYIGVELG